MRHEFADGKYTVIFEPNGRLYALRNGEPWQDFSGNKLLYCMLQEIDDLKAAQALDRAEITQLQTARPRPWKVVHDGDSLGMLQYKGRIFRVQELGAAGYWVNADDNEDLCESLAGVR